MKFRFLQYALKLAVPAILLSSCVKVDQVPAPIPSTDQPLFTAPATFNYETTKEVGVDLQLLANNDQPLNNILVNILDKPADEGGDILFTSMTDINGKISASLKLPSYLTKVIVDPNYVGVMRNATVVVNNQQVYAIIGGANGFGGNVEAKKPALGIGHLPTGNRTQSLNYVYMGGFDNQGKPNYLVSPNDVISKTLLSYINASLPELKPVTTYHPAYLNGSAQTNLDLVQDGDVYITFVHEGAVFMNSLAYFTYPTNNKPTSTNDIDSLHIILPNASLAGSSGSMVSGNKVKLGRFQANTSIGFCLITNGWTGTGVGGGYNKFYTVDALNPEAASVNKRHAAMLRDNTTNVILFGMEDTNRETSGCDNDFNDIVFYASTTNSTNAISTANVNPIDKPGDRDGDGVSDVYDQFPTDPARAYINYYPSQGVWGTVAYEDTWPNTGDYDMNDMIIEYRYKMINNAQNNTVEIYADYPLKAAGATFNSGFGVQFPFVSSQVAAATGSRNSTSFNISLSANGTETGQSRAVIIPFNDFFSITPRPTPATINTTPGIPFIKPDTVHMKVTFTTPLSANNLGIAPFNQFMFRSDTRGKEVHLPGEKPTDKANTALFNTLKDNTVPSLNRYYKTAANMPFALGLPQRFDYPIEGKAINSVYLKFEAWARSGGTQYPNWYKDSAGYRSANWFYK